MNMYVLAGVTARVRRNRPYADVGASQSGVSRNHIAPDAIPNPPTISATPLHAT